MSYDIELIGENGKPLSVDRSHLEHLNIDWDLFDLPSVADINITFNYSKIFYRVLGKNGIRSLYGMTGQESIPVLNDAILQLKDDVTINYWDATEGNVKRDLVRLLCLAVSCPDGIWRGD